MTSIDLSGNMIGLLHPDGVPPPRPDDGHTYPPLPGMEALADCFRANEALTRIDISRNSFGDLGQPSLVKLFDSFQHKKNVKVGAGRRAGRAGGGRGGGGGKEGWAGEWVNGINGANGTLCAPDPPRLPLTYSLLKCSTPCKPSSSSRS